MRTKITKEILIDRLRKKFSNEDGSLIKLSDFKKVSEFLNDVRSIQTEYGIKRFDVDALNMYDDNNLRLEYFFRHHNNQGGFDSVECIYDGIMYLTPVMSRYIDWCYNIGMTEKNQIRKRLEFFDWDYIQENHGLPLTKIMRKYRNLYKDYGT